MSVIDRLAGTASGIDVEKAQRDYAPILIPGEVVHGAFRFYRDIILFTDRRYLEIDFKGPSGESREFLSIPWGRISAFSVETPGIVDVDSEIRLWVYGMPPHTADARKASCSVVRRFGVGVDALGIERVLADHLCPPLS